MRIEHVAIWTAQLDTLRAFYETWFGATAGPLHENPAFGFSSYFLSFDGGARLELMSMPGIPPSLDDPLRQSLGLIHVSFTVGSAADVDDLVTRMAAAGVHVVDGPARTSDGYYEAAILDPDGNRIEIAAG